MAGEAPKSQEVSLASDLVKAVGIFLDGLLRVLSLGVVLSNNDTYN